MSNQNGVPTRDEIRWGMFEMRESSAGKDEVTINMIKLAGDDMIEAVIDVVQHLWSSDYKEWEKETKEAVGVLLYKGYTTLPADTRGYAKLKLQTGNPGSRRSAEGRLYVHVSLASVVRTSDVVGPHPSARQPTRPKHQCQIRHGGSLSGTSGSVW